jgi:hypothetical protein
VTAGSELALLRHVQAQRDAFWADFVRRPARNGPPGRQFVQRPADATPYWVTRETDPEQAEALSLCVYLGAREVDNAVEIPAQCVRIPIPDPYADRPLDLVEEVQTRRAALGLPSPHYCVLAPEAEELWLVWRIRPLHRPARAAAPACHAAWRKLRFAWRMCQLKLALAFADVGAVPTADLYTPLLPLPHDPSRAALLKLGSTYIVEAEPDLPTLVVQDVSGPLDARYDKQAFKALRPLHERTPHWVAKGAWLASDAFKAANAPKPPGFRHPAALTQACILRWAGFTRAEILRHLRQWLATCPSVEGFLDRELQLIADWADRILLPGGPRKASVRGRYQRRREVVAAILLTLEALDAGARPFEGTQADLCRRATLHTGVPVSKSSFQKLLGELEDDGFVSRLVHRRGRASSTAWRLLRLPDWAVQAANDTASAAEAPTPPWRPPELPPTEQLPLTPITDGGVARGVFERSAQPPPSKREKGMGLGGSEPALEVSPPKTWKQDFSKPIFNSESEPDSVDPPSLSTVNNVEQASIAAEPSATRSVGRRFAAKRGNAAEGGGDEPAAVWPTEHERARDAEVLVELGFSLIPLRPHSKRPVPGRWKMAQVARATLTSLRRDLDRHPEANLAVVTGSVSGIVVVDLDNDETVSWAQEHLPATPLTVSTARGEHWYYRLEGACRSFNPMRHVENIAINVKGDGGYVVAPGSRHPTGDRYMPTTTWTAPLLASAPLFSRDWFEPDPTVAASRPADDPTDVLTPLPGESEHTFGQRVFREMNRAMRRGDHKRLRELAALLQNDR